jgi:hypothetical protein
VKLELQPTPIDGGSASVFRAQDGLGRDVAVKMLSSNGDEMSTKLLSQARVLAKADHRNVVRVFYTERVAHPVTGQELDCVVMEYIEGQTFAQLLKGSALSSSEVEQLGQQLLDGIEHLHSLNLPHGDLHEANVLISTQGCVKLIDPMSESSIRLLGSFGMPECIRHDIRSTVFMLQDLITHSDVSARAIEILQSETALAASIEDVRLGFFTALGKMNAPTHEESLQYAKRRLEDDSFVSTEDYSNALLAEIPAGIVMDLLIHLIETKAVRNVHEHIISSLWARLSRPQQARVALDLSNELDDTIPDGTWVSAIRFLCFIGPSAWRMLKRTCALRLEKALIDNFRSGRYDFFRSVLISGALGTWTSRMWESFQDKETLFESVDYMLRANWYSQNYVAMYFMEILSRLADDPEKQKRMKRALASALVNDAHMVKQNLSCLPADWREELKPYFASP